MAKVLGIDLGAHTVKVAVFEGRVGKLELTDYRLRTVPPPEPTPLPELEEGETPPPPPSQRVTLGARLSALGALLDDVSPDDTTVYAVALPADQTSLRSVSLPFSDRDRIAKTLPFELEAHVPFELDDFVLPEKPTEAPAPKPAPTPAPTSAPTSAPASAPTFAPTFAPTIS